MRMEGAPGLGLDLLTMLLLLEVAGPPVPIAATTTPAQQAAALYHAELAHRPLPPPCPRGANGEIVVCGDRRAGGPDRLPLPEERAPLDWAKRPSVDMPSASAASGGGPPPRVNAPEGGAPAILAAERAIGDAVENLVKGKR